MKEPKKRILVADDDVRLLAALRTRLEAAGFEVEVCQDAYQAVDRARKIRPDVMLVDVNMPAGRGFSVQERLNEIEELAGVPVIYVTGEEPDAVDAAASEVGAFAVIHKPFKAPELLATIEAAMACGETLEAPRRCT